MSAVKVLSLFSGAGGLDLGLEAAGMEVVAFCEIEPKAKSLLQYHWPHIPVYNDVKEVSRELLTQDGIAKPDLVAGGSPCQDLSIAGKRGGLDGARSGLFWEQCRIADEYEADILWENVAGALSSNNGADFAAVLWGITGALVELPHGKKWAKAGFLVGPKRTAIWRIIDAQYTGVPQRRRRVYVVGCSGDMARRLAPVLLESEGSEWDYRSSGAEGAHTPRAASVGSAEGGVTSVWMKSRRASSNTDNDVWREQPVTPTLNVMDNTGESYATILGLHDDPSALVSGVTPVQDVREVTKSQNGIGIGNPDDPMYTIDTFVTQGVAYNDMSLARMQAFGQYVEDSIASALKARDYKDATDLVVDPNSNVIANALTVNMRSADDNRAQGGHLVTQQVGQSPLGDTDVSASLGGTSATGGFRFDLKSCGAYVMDDPVIAPTLTAANNPSRSPQSTEITNQVESVVKATAIVRRLTPLEAERLMGWPDNHTKWGHDGKELADSHRYRICGNGVVSNVTKWIGDRYLFCR